MDEQIYYLLHTAGCNKQAARQLALLIEPEIHSFKTRYLGIFNRVLYRALKHFKNRLDYDSLRDIKRVQRSIYTEITRRESNI